MAAIAAAGVGMMMVCCSSSSVMMMMGGNEKETPVVPDTNTDTDSGADDSGVDDSGVDDSEADTPTAANLPVGHVGLCFSGSTKVNMVSGETMCIKDISLGDELAGGTLVDATLQIKNRSNDPFYRFNSTELGDCVYVTGSHYIHHDDKYIFVRDHPEAVLTDKCDDILYCLVTSDHTIPVGEFKFWDWEDNLIRN